MSVAFLFREPTKPKPQTKLTVVVPVRCIGCNRLMHIENAVPIVWKESKRIYGFVCKRPRYSGSRQLWPCHEKALKLHPHPDRIHIPGTGPLSFNPPPLPRTFKKAEPGPKRKFKSDRFAPPEPFSVAAV